ncbi:hypothetical protein PPL_06720 [Heterostelium album PN500]|uniref:Uncharacterized protein n=1 Tax=Heterostelium pallidum (strain ATCC 26659 / Pp 5 / PN500) TaxID=670386 RepID=D3BFI6_HETP5|nr:hypothetical protein PPL_06720 [Heterostelium album PN500]EFA79900.1 hypothetical protein PPL_06720 [Heterostelium album PN500]|eukprot:XP_020432021.1 hypothetical protein PPL_06720 [Heterostelium album PN500]
MNQKKIIVVLLVAIISSWYCNAKSQPTPTPSSKYPVPLIPGQRNAVHGWLILPLDQFLPNPNDPAQPVQAYFSHHTPEFPTDSPHDFQIIFLGTLTPLSSGENITYPIDLPYPPASELLQYEFTFTPPPPFSLNDLLSGQIKQLLGVVYNGSFDTPYEREAISVATLDIYELTTATYLNDSQSIQSYTSQRYLSYPRLGMGLPLPSGGQHHFYWAHEIHAVPDFDQVVHVVIDLDSCVCGNNATNGCSNDPTQYIPTVYQAASSWEIQGIPNDVEHRLLPETTPYIQATLVSNGLTCKAEVVEQIHCVLGPMFYEIC